MALIVPPLPAASRPSNMTTMRNPLYLTHSCSLQSPVCRRRSSSEYFLGFIICQRGWEVGGIGAPPRRSDPDQVFGGWYEEQVLHSRRRSSAQSIGRFRSCV